MPQVTPDSVRRKQDGQDFQELVGTGELMAQEEPQPNQVPVQQTRDAAPGRQLQHRTREP
jgi:hypothetical protein